MMQGSDTPDPVQGNALGWLARVGIPPIIGFLVLAAYVGAEALGFRGLAAPEADTVSEAAALGHAARVLELIARGQHPNDRFPVRPSMMDTGGRELVPLEAAVLGRHAELVRLLRRSGATPSGPRIVCLARARLPEVLPDLGAESTAPADSPVDITTALESCSTSG
jgi:hypothetical protein